jgi:hypothetical protein
MEYTYDIIIVNAFWYDFSNESFVSKHNESFPSSAFAPVSDCLYHKLLQATRGLKNVVDNVKCVHEKHI